MYSKNLINAAVISLAENTSVGFISKLFINRSTLKLCFLVVKSLEGENCLFLPFGKIISFVEDKVCIENNDSLIDTCSLDKFLKPLESQYRLLFKNSDEISDEAYSVYLTDNRENADFMFLKSVDNEKVLIMQSNKILNINNDTIEISDKKSVIDFADFVNSKEEDSKEYRILDKTILDTTGRAIAKVIDFYIDMETGSLETIKAEGFQNNEVFDVSIFDVIDNNKENLIIDMDTDSGTAFDLDTVLHSVLSSSKAIDEPEIDFNSSIVSGNFTKDEDHFLIERLEKIENGSFDHILSEIFEEDEDDSNNTLPVRDSRENETEIETASSQFEFDINKAKEELKMKEIEKLNEIAKVREKAIHEEITKQIKQLEENELARLRKINEQNEKEMERKFYKRIDELEANYQAKMIELNEAKDREIHKQVEKIREELVLRDSERLQQIVDENNLELQKEIEKVKKEIKTQEEIRFKEILEVKERKIDEELKKQEELTLQVEKSKKKELEKLEEMIRNEEEARKREYEKQLELEKQKELDKKERLLELDKLENERLKIQLERQIERELEESRIKAAKQEKLKMEAALKEQIELERMEEVGRISQEKEFEKQSLIALAKQKELDQALKAKEELELQKAEFLMLEKERIKAELEEQNRHAKENILIDSSDIIEKSKVKKQDISRLAELFMLQEERADEADKYQNISDQDELVENVVSVLDSLETANAMNVLSKDGATAKTAPDKKAMDFQELDKIKSETKGNTQEKKGLSTVNNYIKNQRDKLIGKTVLKDIQDKYGNILLDKGSKITASDFDGIVEVDKDAIIVMAMYSE